MGASDLDPSTDPPLEAWRSGPAEGAHLYTSPSQALHSRAVLSVAGGDAAASGSLFGQLSGSMAAPLWSSEQLGGGGSSVTPPSGPQTWYSLDPSAAGCVVSSGTQAQQSPWTVSPLAVAGGAPNTQYLQVVSIPCPATPSPVTPQLVCLADGTLLSVPPSPQPSQQQQQQQVVYVIPQQQQQQQQVLLLVNPSGPAGNGTPGVQMMALQTGATGQMSPLLVTQPPAAAAGGTQSWVLAGPQQQQQQQPQQQQPQQQQQQQQPTVLVLSSPSHSGDLSMGMHTLVLSPSSSQALSVVTSGDGGNDGGLQGTLEPPGLATPCQQQQQQQAAEGGAGHSTGVLWLPQGGNPPASKPGAATDLGHSSDTTNGDPDARSSISGTAATNATCSQDATDLVPKGAAAQPQAAGLAVLPLERGPAAVLSGSAWGELLVARGALVVLLEVTWGVLTWTQFGTWGTAVRQQPADMWTGASGATAPPKPAEDASNGQGASGGGAAGSGAAVSYSLTQRGGLDLVNAVNTPKLLQLLQTWRSAIWTLTHTVAAARRALPAATWAKDLSQVLCAADASIAFSCPWDVGADIMPQGLARALQLPPPRFSSMSRPLPLNPSPKGCDSSGSGAPPNVAEQLASLNWEQLPQSFNSALAISHYARTVSLPGLQALVAAGRLPASPQLVRGSAPQWREMALQARVDYRQLKLPFPSRVVPATPPNPYGPPRPPYAPPPKRPVTY